MGYAKYVGRVGGLAVALGVGVAVATMPGVAWAGPSDSGSTSTSTDSPSSTSSSSTSSSESSTGTSSASAPTESSQSSASAGDEGAGASGDSSGSSTSIKKSEDTGGKKSTTTATVKDKKSGSDKSTAAIAPKKPKRQVPSTPSGGDTSGGQSVTETTTSTQPKSEPLADPAPTSVSVDGARQPAPPTVTPVAQVESAPEPEVTPLSSTMLSATGLAPSADGDAPEVPGDSPLMLAGLAAFRRQTQQGLVEDEALTKTASDPSQSSLMMSSADSGTSEPMMMAAAVGNSAPSASPTVGSPDAVSGVVTGSMNAFDPDGNPLTYTVQSQSAGADVAVNSSGNFTYTPSVTQRMQAAATAGMDTDTFTVRISDGQAVTDVPVTVVVRPGQLTVGAPIAVGRDPSGVAFNADGSKAYVTNKYDKTVSVIDTTNGAVLATIKVPYAPTAVVVNPVSTTNRAYVAMTTGVAVINTATNKIVDVNTATATVDSIKVGASPSALAINSTGTRLYVSNGGSSTVSVINTATNTEIAKVTVGSQPSGLAVSPDDGRVYALSRYNDSVTVFSTASNTVIGSVKVGDSPRGVVVSPDGQRLYISNYSSGTVTVLNSSTPTPTFVKTITVGTQPEGIAISKDGSMVYVANGRDTVSVIDTRTNTVMGSAVPIDSPAESGAHAIALSGNKIYVTDYVDDFVRVLDTGRVQSVQNPPQANGSPTVGTPDPATGRVIGDLNVIDTDGDPLSYSVFDAPDKGSVAVTSAGMYTYTPTDAARVQSPNTTDTFIVRVSDGQAFKDVTVTVPIAPKPPNQAPVVNGSTIPGMPDWVTGTVTGTMNISDPNHDQLTYTLTSPPTQGGTVTFDQQTGRFTYTPSQSARNAAAQTPGLDYDTFGVSATDGIATVSTTVKVQVSQTPPPTTPTSTAGVAAGSGPSGSAIAGGYAYVINYDSNNVTVVNAATNQFVKTIDVGQGPLSVAANDARKRVYVTNSASNTVSVIDANTNSVIDTIDIDVQPGTAYDPWYGEPYEYPNKVTEVAVSGNRLYVNATDGRVYVVDTTNDNNTVIQTASLGTFNDLDVSPDGTRLYGVRGGGLTVINTSTMTATDIVVGPSWNDDVLRNEYTTSVGNAAVSPDGKRTYVTYGVTIAERGVGGQPSGSFFSDSQGRNWMYTGGYNAVAVIDTDPTSANYNKEIARIIVPAGTQDVAVSGSNLYVTSGDGKTVTIINTTNNALVGTFTTDQTSSGGRYIYLDDYWTPVAAFTRYITVGPNGVVYVTDYTDGKVYAVTIGSQSV